MATAATAATAKAALTEVPVATGLRTKEDGTMTAAQRALRAYVTASARERAETLRAKQKGATAAYYAVSDMVTGLKTALFSVLPSIGTSTSVVPSSELVVEAIFGLLGELDTTKLGLFTRQPVSSIVDYTLNNPEASSELRDPYVVCQVIRRLIAGHPNIFYNPSEGIARRMRDALQPILRQMAKVRKESIGQLLKNYFLHLPEDPSYKYEKMAKPAAPFSSNLMTALGFVYDATGTLNLDLALIGTISLGANPTSTDTVPAFMTFLLNMFRAEWASEAALFRESPAHTGAGHESKDPLKWASTLKRFIALNPDLFLTPSPALHESMLTASAPLLSAMMSVDTTADTLNKGKQGEHKQFSCAHIKAFLSALSRACGGAAREDFEKIQSMLPVPRETTVVPDRATLVTALGFAYNQADGTLIWDKDRLAAISAALRGDEAAPAEASLSTTSSSELDSTTGSATSDTDETSGE